MSKQNLQLKYWDSNIDPKNLSHEFNLETFNYNLEKEFYFSPEQNYAYKIMGNVKRKRILEIGCGIGINALILTELGANVFVIDIASNRLKTLKILKQRFSNFSDIHLFEASSENLPFQNEFFDIVYTKSVLIHTDLKKSASEIHRVLKKNGLGVFIEPMDLNPFAFIYRKFFGPKEWKEITNYFNPERFKILGELFNKRIGKDFFILGFIAFYYQFHKRAVKKFKLMLNFTNKIDSFLIKYIPYAKRFAWFKVFCVRK